MIKALILVVAMTTMTAGQQRVAPGVPQGQYQGGQQGHPPPQHQQYQQPNQPQYRQAPGVPPQQYQQQQQQQPQYQQQQQPQYQQQQQQQQFQQPQPPAQPPPQQQQQQFQQPPPPQQHHQGGHQAAAGQGIHQPHKHDNHQRVQLHNPNLSDERDHIKDHLEVPIDTSGMSEQELQYHYFKMHDADNNNKLDGQELIKSLFHWHDAANHDPEKTGHPAPEAKLFTDEELTAMIDPILDQDDKNKDGYIDYPEFVQAQRNAASNAAATNKV